MDFFLRGGGVCSGICTKKTPCNHRVMLTGGVLVLREGDCRVGAPAVGPAALGHGGMLMWACLEGVESCCVGNRACPRDVMEVVLGGGLSSWHRITEIIKLEKTSGIIESSL